MNQYFQTFKQAWNLIRQEKLFSSIYIVGTGLSITVVMVLSIVLYLKIANIYPETNRNRMLIIKSGMEKSKKQKDSNMASLLSYPMIETCLFPIKSAEAVTATINDQTAYIQSIDGKEDIQVIILSIDTRFWTVFPFRFIDGKPFTEADFQSAVLTAVITESLAKRLFGTKEATGQSFSLDFHSYRVSGVVKDASPITTTSYAQVYIPYTISSHYKNRANWVLSSDGIGRSLGAFRAYLLAPSSGDLEKVRQEAIENIAKYNQTLQDFDFSVLGQPDRHWQSILRFWTNNTPDFTKIRLQYAVIFLILLLVPAVSLSGMTESRMERRLSEMGIRRTFGAPVNRLMRQIISENFLFTLLGGIIGLLLSYTFILLCRSWIMQIGIEDSAAIPAGTNVTFTPAMLLNFQVFGIALCVCFLLNLLSSLIPAWRASRREIVFSLNAKF